MSQSGLFMYREMAKHYDAIYDSKDYRNESKLLEKIALRFGVRGRTSWLDVACGTGRHLEFLRRRHSTTGLDISPEMLRYARQRLKGVPLSKGDMRNFRLNRRFNVLSCLFSAIGHLQTEKDVRMTFSNFASHLKPGGVAIVEPWIQPSDFHPGKSYLRTFESSTVKIVRFASSSLRGNRSVVKYHYLIARPGRAIQHFEETDVGLLLSRKRLVELMELAGLRSRFVARGLIPGRGLIVGVKSVEE